jgi:hypothetical protein
MKASILLRSAYYSLSVSSSVRSSTNSSALPDHRGRHRDFNDAELAEGGWIVRFLGVFSHLTSTPFQNATYPFMFAAAVDGSG